MQARFATSTLLSLALFGVFLAPSAKAQTEGVLSQKVSFSISATLAPECIRQLGQKAGLNLMVGSEFVNEPILIHSVDQPIGETMKQIAEAVTGEWVKEANGYRLIRSNNSKEKLQKDHLSYWLKAYEKPLREVKERASRFKPMTAEEAKQIASDGAQRRADLLKAIETGTGPVMIRGQEPLQTPALRTLNRIVATLTPANLAKLDFNSRSVFAMSPTQRQVSLSSEAIQVIRQFEQEYAVFQSVSQAQASPTPSDPNLMILDDQGDMKPLKGPVGEALLVLQKQVDGTILVNLAIADSKGDVVASSSIAISPEVAPSLVPEGISKSSESIQVSSDSKVHAQLLNFYPESGGSDIMVLDTGGDGGEERSFSIAVTSGVALGGPVNSRPAIDADWRNKLRNADKIDSLSFGVSDMLKQMAQQTNRSIVACVSDDAISSTVGALAGDGMTLSSFLTNLSRENTIINNQSWIVIRPTDHLRTSVNRYDRKATRELLSAIVADNRLTLDAACRFAASVSPRSDSSPLVARLVDHMNPAAFGTYDRIINADLQTAQFFASMSASRRKMLADGAEIPISQLSLQDRNVLAEIVYNSFQGPIISEPRQGNEERRVMAFSTAGGGHFGGQLSNLKYERTKHLNFGLPSGTLFKLGITSENCLLATESATQKTRFFKPEEYAMYASISEDPEGVLAQHGGVTKYDRFQLASRTVYSLRFQFTQMATLTKRLMDSQANPGTRPAPYENLPKEIRERIENPGARVRLGSGQRPPVQ